MRILVAEDDPVSRRVLETALTKLGHEPVLTDNGRDAWDCYVRSDVRMVISDWMMPTMDGLELTRKIRARERATYSYVILLTAMSGKANYLQGMEAGADDFVTKPVDVEELAARLRVAERILSLEGRVKTLEGLLPICAYCKDIRDEQDTWHRLENYIQRRSAAEFTHGICPRCIEKLKESHQIPG
jgi:DNA-binding response OmpR family regulator